MGRSAARRLPRPRLVPAQPAPARPGVRAAGAAVGAFTRPAGLPARLADRPRLFRGEPPRGAGAVLLTLAPAAVLFALGARPGLQAAVAAQPAARCNSSRSCSWPTSPSTGPSPLPSGARGSGGSTRSTTRPRRWTGWRARAAPGGHRRDARALVRAALRAGLRAARALRVPRLRLVPRGLHPRQRPLALRRAERWWSSRRASITGTTRRAARPSTRTSPSTCRWIDRLFGTRYLPHGRWPAAYGLAGEPVPDGWLRQLVLAVPAGARRGH